MAYINFRVKHHTYMEHGVVEAASLHDVDSLYDK